MSTEVSERVADTPAATQASPAATVSGVDPLPPPRHIAIIMDGNGRWARERGLPRIKGHEQGASSVRAVTEGCAELGVRYLTVFAFSTENWKRPKEETDALMGLLEQFIGQELPGLMKNRIRLRAIGRTHDLPPNCRKALQDAIDATAQNDRMTLILALSYSGRSELIDAVRALCREALRGELNPDDIDTARISSALDTRDFPDPDLLIRTSGEMRLSNFLLWQLSYTEIYVTEKLWPDFGKDDLRDAIAAFHKRERRFGGI